MNGTINKVLIAVMVAMVGMSGAVAGASVTADFTATPDDPYTGEQVEFDGTTSATDGTNISYEYDFDGDGTYDASGATVNHTFDTAGDHDVTIKVTDEDDGTTDTFTDTITVHSKDSYEVTGAVNTAGTAENLNVVIGGDSQSHDIITNGDFTTTLEEGTTFEIVYINSTGDAVDTNQVQVGDGNVTGVAVDDASFDYSEEVASTGGTTSESDSTDWMQLIKENVVVALIVTVILTMFGIRSRGAKK